MGKTFTRERINHKAMLALTLVGACLCSGGCSLSPVAKYSPLAAFERSVIYQPADGTVGNWNPDGLNHEDVSFVSNDGTKLHGWFVPHSQPTAVALFLHGNAGNVTSRAQKLAGLNQQFGLSVMAFDYRGYGRSEGSPDEQGILNDARAARRWLAQRTGVSEADILIWVVLWVARLRSTWRPKTALEDLRSPAHLLRYRTWQAATFDGCQQNC